MFLYLNAMRKDQVKENKTEDNSLYLELNFLDRFKSLSNLSETFSGHEINRPPEVCASARINFSQEVQIPMLQVYEKKY